MDTHVTDPFDCLPSVFSSFLIKLCRELLRFPLGDRYDDQVIV